jgi:hypothetical protein
MIDNTFYIDSASISNLSASGSLLGTASWANNSQTASYITSSNIYGTVTSASYSLTSSAATSITFVPNLSATASSITTISNTILNYLSGSRSNIQLQLDQLNGNAGLTSTPIITNNNDGTITVSSASVNLYNNPYGTGVITSYQLSPATLALDPSQLNIVTATVSNGNAIYQIIYNQTGVDDISVIPVAGINITGVDGTGWHYLEFDFGTTGLALPNKLGLKDVSLNGNQRQSGLLLSAGTATDFSISAGSSWYSVKQTSFDVFDSYNYPTCITSYLIQSASVWSSSYGVGYINGYYNGPYGLTPLAPNSCSVNYIYKILANNINGAIVVMGGQYDNILDAQADEPPSNIPASIASFCLLTGRMIVQSGSTSPTVQSAYTTQFGAATISNHNDLLGLQGGQGGEYYHMTQAEYLGNGTGVFVRHSGTVASASAANSITFTPNLSNTASYVLNAVSASYFPQAYQISSSWASSSISSSYSATSSIIPFNGNRTIKRTGYTTINAGGNDIYTFLNNFFFPFLPATVGISGGGTYQTGSLQSPTITTTITANDETIFGSGSVFKDSALWNTKATIPPLSFTYTDTNISSNHSYQSSIQVDNNGVPTIISSTTTSATFIYPYLWGMSATPGLSGTSLYSAFTSQLVTSGNKTVALNGSTVYIYFCYPSTYAALTSILDPNSFETIGSFDYSSSVSVTSVGLTNNWTNTYKVYRSTLVADPAGNFQFKQ